MDVPENLDAWTFETVVDIVIKHDFEPGRFDFKEVLNPTKDSSDPKKAYAASICRTTCSLANYDFGGFILFGVKDPAVPTATPLDRIVGIPRSFDLRKGFGEKVQPIEPEVYFDVKAIDHPGDATKCIFVAQIPTSTRRPHMFEDRFYIRGEGGSARPMRVDEVRSQMLYTEGRLQKVRLLRLELATILDFALMQNTAATSSVRFEVGGFKVLLADICDLLQPDSGLLGLLHEIASRATALNYLLDRQAELRPLAITNQLTLNPLLRDEIAKLTSDVPNRRSELHNKVAEAQQRLEALFRPLPTS